MPSPSAHLTPAEQEAELGRYSLQCNLSQATMAARAGISLRALRNLEAGQEASLTTFIHVVRALGRESWFQTLAPMPTINPLTMTRAATPRQRATQPRRPPGDIPHRSGWSKPVWNLLATNSR
ncbi:helix-turn-helix domain-containing protein [Chromobacterium sp. IIBBL 290-4]|uniref:helix-turn-helix domain-containing protein n=1 Tax=Chromobacterium sp. IIBBL 290-4 TaxID=2953890 RepID=UPI0020B6FF65|nr:helix-turn-helix transcriptional regulator [Chromobacterium sp. IIBBL 290-4]UTH75652.1 helix-turn-helix domain-containing protein [Chromobacterium sp. IIBBL 290-4]